MNDQADVSNMALMWRNHATGAYSIPEPLRPGSARRQKSQPLNASVSPPWRVRFALACSVRRVRPHQHTRWSWHLPLARIALLSARIRPQATSTRTFKATASPACVDNVAKNKHARGNASQADAVRCWPVTLVRLRGRIIFGTPGVSWAPRARTLARWTQPFYWPSKKTTRHDMEHVPKSTQCP